MEKTKEERAKDSVCWDCDAQEYDVAIVQYLKGDADRKAIDIEKACKYACSLCHERNTEECPTHKYCKDIKDLRKAMEE